MEDGGLADHGSACAGCDNGRVDAGCALPLLRPVSVALPGTGVACVELTPLALPVALFGAGVDCESGLDAACGVLTCGGGSDGCGPLLSPLGFRCADHDG